MLLFSKKDKLYLKKLEYIYDLFLTNKNKKLKKGFLLNFFIKASNNFTLPIYISNNILNLNLININSYK